MIRPARISDVQDIAQLVNGYAQRNLMLSRPLNRIYESLRDYFVVEEEGALIGCGALHVLWYDLAEIRSVAIAEEHAGKGHGRKVVEALLEDARRLGIHQVFMLILPGGPMAKLSERLSFHEVSKEVLPHKVWGDCLNCPKFTQCDEIAVIIEAGPKVESSQQWSSVMDAYARRSADRDAVPTSHVLPLAKRR